MKNIKFLSGLLLILIAFVFTSCENEPVDAAVLSDVSTPTCTAPTAFQASNFINNNSVSLSWVAGGSEASWTIQYGIQGFALGAGTIVTSTETTYVVNGLSSTNSYSFYIKSNCGTNSTSGWVGPVTVQATPVNPNCPNPSNLIVVRDPANNTNIDMTWAAGGTETSWQVQYGVSGFLLGSGTIVQTTTNAMVLNGLSVTDNYDFYVRSNCSTTENSSWIGPVTLQGLFTIVYGNMSANVNSQQHNDMKPYLYTYYGIKAKLENPNYLPADGKVLVVQGNTDPLTPNSSSFTEIYINLSQAFWQPGTYVLNPATSTPSTRVEATMRIVTSATDLTEEVPMQGTITIVEFDTVNKRIRGTFSFPYMEVSTTSSTGPFQVTNGTFDFSIKDDVFQ